MKLTKIILTSVFTASVVYAQSGATLFNTYCSSCHTEVLGTNESGGKITHIYEAPFAGDIVQKLKLNTKNKDEFISFIKDYINIPSKRKSLYGQKAIKEFGLMPSLNGVLTDNESTKLATFLYQDYNKETKKEKKENINKIAKESLFTTYCSSCHAEVLGTNESGGKITHIYAAPYVKDIVKKLKIKTKSKSEFISFIKDYINLPSKRKSLYGKKAIKEFGLMPSLSGVLSDKESTKLANDLYINY